MKAYLNLDEEKLKKILDIKLKVFRREMSPAEAKKLVNDSFTFITPEEFAYGEQHILEYGITDEVMVEGMDDIIDIFEDVLRTEDSHLPQGHPIQTYLNEVDALEALLRGIEAKMNTKFIKNEWLELYDKLRQINTHFSRKQKKPLKL
ncbi:hypothetical protein [Saccharicrinis fermentans]|uniref:Uncharacterized protein n=1 Tax=Saccharicrinis fermentans DSM 9555 = JCM 21142 TaxID=869213 RepID=W7Y9W8_9BACT|nr:hypothetical protein [Saccharicrinis fermentans]GAF04328.1 hypothetical protein JCM21142_73030 [Saccharicrinis fermentans DSM 9555 = JCM 21142]